MQSVHSMLYERYQGVVSGFKAREYLRCLVIPVLQGKGPKKTGLKTQVKYSILADKEESMWDRLVQTESARAEYAAGTKSKEAHIASLEMAVSMPGGRSKRKELTAAKNDLGKWLRDNSATAPEKAQAFLLIVKDLVAQPEKERGVAIVMYFQYTRYGIQKDHNFFVCRREPCGSCAGGAPVNGGQCDTCLCCNTRLTE